MFIAQTGGLRIAAALIDALLCVGLSLLLYTPGWILSTAYWLLRDGLFEGQSVGKRVMGLKVVAGAGRLRAGWKESAVRNVLWVIPLVNLVGAVAGLWYLCSDPEGRHWGDRLADTRVVKV